MSKEKQYKFTAELKEGKRGGVGIQIPFNVEKEFGTKGQVKVKATFDGKPYRGSIAPLGEGVHFIGVYKSIRKAIGKTSGDKVKVTIEKDTEPRTVDVPGDFQNELNKNQKAKEIFNNFAYTHKKEYVRWIEEAKKQETRKRRLLKAVEMIAGGKKYS